MVIIEDEVKKLLEPFILDNGDLYCHNFSFLIKKLKEAQQKGIYSEEDLRKAMNMTLEIDPKNICGSRYTNNQIIQSINQEYIKLEMEEKQHFEKDKTKRVNPLNGVFYETRIKTDRVNDQLIAYLKN
jgi:hypothetical protein